MIPIKKGDFDDQNPKQRSLTVKVDELSLIHNLTQTPKERNQMSDLPEEVANLIKEKLQKIPYFDVVFTGNFPDEVLDKMETYKELNVQYESSWKEGKCADCGEKVPGEWNEKDEPKKIPEGWEVYGSTNNEESNVLICPKCEQETPVADDDSFNRSPFHQDFQSMVGKTIKEIDDGFINHLIIKFTDESSVILEIGMIETVGHTIVPIPSQ